MPFYDAREVKLCRVLTDRGTEYCGNPEHHEYELYLALEDIDHSRTKTKSAQTNGIAERFHKTLLDEFSRVAFRNTIYATIDDLQADLDSWVQSYNEERPHQGRLCLGKTLMRTFLDATPLAKERRSRPEKTSKEPTHLRRSVGSSSDCYSSRHPGRVKTGLGFDSAAPS